MKQIAFNWLARITGTNFNLFLSSKVLRSMEMLGNAKMNDDVRSTVQAIHQNHHEKKLNQFASTTFLAFINSITAPPSGCNQKSKVNWVNMHAVLENATTKQSSQKSRERKNLFKVFSFHEHFAFSTQRAFSRSTSVERSAWVSFREFQQFSDLESSACLRDLFGCWKIFNKSIFAFWDGLESTSCVLNGRCFATRAANKSCANFYNFAVK